MQAVPKNNLRENGQSGFFPHKLEEIHFKTDALSRYHKRAGEAIEVAKGEYPGYSGIKIDAGLEEYMAEFAEEIRNLLSDLSQDRPLNLRVEFLEAENSNLATMSKLTRHFIGTVLDLLPAERRPGVKLIFHFPGAPFAENMVLNHMHPEQGQITVERN